jgi:hypothetical protein
MGAITKMDQDWQKHKAIGNMTEAVVEMLIKSMPDWKCIKFGMENHIGELRKSLKSNHTSESRRVRTMPDFIALNKKTNEVIFIDVKYRSFIDRRNNGEALYGFGYGQIKDYLEFWKDMKLIVVHPQDPHFYVIDMKEIEWHKHFHSRTKTPTGLMHEQWNFAGIEKPITSLFPNLIEEAIKSSSALIHGKKE